ncbi:MAG: hypothetical protein GAK36_00177 [Pseudomonas sp.]|nr:MAG: hypothetical protein GAK36_00177 [Pseudomonas sp.]
MVAVLPGIYDTGGNWMEMGNSGVFVQNFQPAN